MPKKLKAKKDKNGKDVKIDYINGEKKSDFLRRLVKKYAGESSELPNVFGAD
jgi:hypothetical protein